MIVRLGECSLRCRRGEHTADDLIALDAGAAIRKHPHMYFGAADDGLRQAIITPAHISVRRGNRRTNRGERCR